MISKKKGKLLISKKLKGNYRKMKRQKSLKWDKLDNTANIFPVIAREGMSNVYRISVVLKEEIKGELLQDALNTVLPYFDVFKFSMKRGIFWYYFEENKRPAPIVKEEYTYPCMYINPYSNHNYLFRVSYYKNRINLEVFHALTDGNGAINFLKEITYQYIRNAHPELSDQVKNTLAIETSLDTQDSYVRNYKRKEKKTYKTKKAVTIKGEKLPINQFAIIHGIMPINDIKSVAKKYGVTINTYIVAAYIWAIYLGYLNGAESKKPIAICVPVNLRPYFDSDTNKNFFVVVTAEFTPVKEKYEFEEVLAIVKESLEKQITKENLEKLFSYNVSNEKNIMLRAIPLFIKKIAMRYVYNASAKANTSTVTNLGIIKTSDPYSQFIERFQAVLSMSKGQNIKITVFSFKDKLTLTFSANIAESEIQKQFFRKLTADGVNVSIETNGVYYE